MLTLYRYNYGIDLTQGVLFDEKGYVGDTLELPWKFNTLDVSCIPQGDYEIVYRNDESYHVKEAYTVEPVHKREGILIHVANEISELKGCIAIGIKSDDIVIKSRETFEKLKLRVGAKASLKIVGLYV